MDGGDADGRADTGRGDGARRGGGAGARGSASAEAQARTREAREAREAWEAQAREREVRVQEAREAVEAVEVREAWEARVREAWKTRVQAEAEAEAEAQAQVPALALARAQAVALALTDSPRPYANLSTITYEEILADSKLKDIIYSIKPDNRHKHAHRLWRRSQDFWWLIQIITPITRLPSELLQQILLVVIDNASDDDASNLPSVLMFVCKHWYTIINRLWASVNLGTTTPKDAITSKLNQWHLDLSVDTEIDRGDFTPSERAYNAIFAAIEASSRWRSFIVKTFPPQADLPEHLVNHGLQRCSNPVMSRLRTFRIMSPCEMSPLIDWLLRTLGTTASRELTTVEINSPNVIAFLVPTYSPIFRSVTVLSLDTPGLRNPIDLLPHLHQLESLTVSHLPLPTYHDDVDLPFVHTLRHLRLRAASIQWMSGKTFHVLESCTLLFPLHRHVLHTFRTTLPNCTDLTFRGYPLNILDGISTSKHPHVSVACSCVDKPRGYRQLVQFSSQAIRESRLAPRILHISIEATNKAWTKAFAFMSNLEELVISNARPSSLGAKTLQSLFVHPVHANNLGTTATLGGRDTDTPLCPSLKRFGLRYQRWLRPSEHFDLIPEFMSIIWSRQQSKLSLQSFRIWTRSDEEDPLELIEGSWISLEGFERLANESKIKGWNLLQLMTNRVVENTFKPRPLPHALKCD
jgi:hypothetical protein